MTAEELLSVPRGTAVYTLDGHTGLLVDWLSHGHSAEVRVHGRLRQIAAKHLRFNATTRALTEDDR